MSGRGLGHTGGTLDKLESIPGFRVELTTDEFVAQVREVGLAIIGQTARPRAGRQAALRAARRDGDGRHRPADRGDDHVEEARRRRGRDRARRQGRRRRVHEDARRRARARRDDARARRAGPAARSSACSPTWTSRSAARSATRSRSARRSRRCAARGRRTSPSSCSTPARACSRSPTSASTTRRAAAGGGGGGGRLRARGLRALDPGAGRRSRRRRAAGAPVVREVAAPRGRLRHAPRRDRGRASPRSSSAPAGARRTDEIDHAVGVVCRAKRGDEVARGRRRSRRCTRATRRRPQAAAEAVLAAYEIGDEAPPERGIVLDVVA